MSVTVIPISIILSALQCECARDNVHFGKVIVLIGSSLLDLSVQCSLECTNLNIKSLEIIVE